MLLPGGNFSYYIAYQQFDLKNIFPLFGFEMVVEGKMCHTDRGTF